QLGLEAGVAHRAIVLVLDGDLERGADREDARLLGVAADGGFEVVVGEAIARAVGVIVAAVRVVVVLPLDVGGVAGGLFVDGLDVLVAVGGLELDRDGGAGRVLLGGDLDLHFVVGAAGVGRPRGEHQLLLGIFLV